MQTKRLFWKQKSEDTQEDDSLSLIGFLVDGSSNFTCIAQGLLNGIDEDNTKDDWDEVTGPTDILPAILVGRNSFPSLSSSTFRGLVCLIGRFHQCDQDVDYFWKSTVQL